MFVILTYDVRAKRDPAVMRICRKYLRHTQKSVFEGVITEAKLQALKNELKKKIDVTQDAVCIYKMESLKFTSKEEIGTIAQFSNII